MPDPLDVLDRLAPDDKIEKTQAVTHFSCRKCVKFAYVIGAVNALQDIINRIDNPVLQRPGPAPVRPPVGTPNLPSSPPGQPQGIGLGFGWLDALDGPARAALKQAIVVYRDQIAGDPSFSLMLQHERAPTNQSMRVNALNASKCCRRKTLTQRNERRADVIKPHSRPIR